MKFSNFFDVEDDFNYQSEKKKFINNMDKLKSMSVEEQTLYKKILKMGLSSSRNSDIMYLIAEWGWIIFGTEHIAYSSY